MGAVPAAKGGARQRFTQGCGTKQIRSEYGVIEREFVQPYARDLLSWAFAAHLD